VDEPVSRSGTGSRTTVRLLVGVLAAAALATGCGTERTTGATGTTAAEDSSRESAPATSAAEDPSPSAAEPGSTGSPLAVYWVGRSDRGPRLFREFASAGGGSPVQSALDLLAAGAPADGDYTSRWPAGSALTAATSADDGTLTVDLGGTAADGDRADAVLALQQLVHTVTAADTDLTGVRLSVDGEPVADLWDGAEVPASGARRADPLDVLAPIWMDAVTDGATVGRTVRFGGAASVFEGTVSWQVLAQPSGEVVRVGFSTAADGAPGRGGWTASTQLDPGRYVLRAFEESAESGQARFIDDKTVTVR
jgi:hypothetical protein